MSARCVFFYGGDAWSGDEAPRLFARTAEVAGLAERR